MYNVKVTMLENLRRTSGLDFESWEKGLGCWMGGNKHCFTRLRFALQDSSKAPFLNGQSSFLGGGGLLFLSFYLYN